MAKANLREHRERHVRPLTQVQLFTTTAYAELFEGQGQEPEIDGTSERHLSGMDQRNRVAVSKS